MGKALGGILAGIFSAFAGSYTISTLWSWFLVPAGFAAISMFTAYGIMLISALLLLPAMIVVISQFYASKMDEDMPGYAIALIGIVMYTFALLIGLIVSSLFG